MKQITCVHQNRQFGQIEIYGTYEGDVSRTEIVQHFGNGAYGHRFIYFDEGTFILVKYVYDEELIDD